MKLRQCEPHVWMFDDSDSVGVLALLDDALGRLGKGDLVATEKKLNNILEQYPQHIDSWNHLAAVYEYSNRLTEAYLAYREAYRLGMEAIPVQFDWEQDLLEWFFLENRPFLRACFNLGVRLLKNKNNGEAEKIFLRLVTVSPHDNLGARYHLLKIFLETKNTSKLEWLFSKYPDDYSPEFMYGKVLFALANKNHTEASVTFMYAKDEFPFVEKELKKKRHTKPKDLNSQFITVGGKDQAYIYWCEFGHLWQEGTLAYDILFPKV